LLIWINFPGMMPGFPAKRQSAASKRVVRVGQALEPDGGLREEGAVTFPVRFT
jgi:hypothetical protein